jgi:hypothetical protein
MSSFSKKSSFKKTIWESSEIRGTSKLGLVEGLNRTYRRAPIAVLEIQELILLTALHIVKIYEFKIIITKFIIYNLIF